MCRLSDDEGNTVDTNAVKVTIPPQITVQPTDVAAKAGDTVSFHVEATGATGYQWYYSKDNGEKWLKITNWEGCTSDTLVAKMTTTRMKYIYMCRLTDDEGNNVDTQAVKVTEPIESNLQITAQPTDVLAEVGDTVSFHVEATGATGYQWYYSKDNGTKWLKIANWEGCTSDTLTAKMTSTRMGYSYMCRLVDDDGNTVDTIVVKVNP
jgi:hypothetical protein